MELKELYLKGLDSLSKCGLQYPGIEARAILSKSLDVESIELYAHPQKWVDSERIEAFNALLKRRIAREPLSYLTGKREFFSRSFSVNPCVLIPRPETETLAELAIKTAEKIKKPRILDLGTGSGCLAITISLEVVECEVFASDISLEALLLAQKNASELGSQIVFVNSDILSCFAESTFDMIISNPPYVSEFEYQELSEEINRYEPRTALVGGSDGLEYIKAIAESAGRTLCRGGFLLLEVGAGQAEMVGEIAFENGFCDIGYEDDISGIKRVVKASWKK